MDELNVMPLPDLYRRLSGGGGGGLVRRVLELARDEDLGAAGDVTSRVSVQESDRARVAIVARQPGMVAGLAVLPELVAILGAGVEIRLETEDGRPAPAGVTLAVLSGPKRNLLALERTALNLIGRLSGIATRTAEFVRVLNMGGPVKARLYDTRKTTPGLRVLEKYAVRCGGGMCHRIGLFDAVLIKDNHLAGVGLADLARAVADASRRARAEHRALSFVEVEVDSLEQLERVLGVERGLIDIVLLDNMNPMQLRRAVAMRDASASRPELEASGGVGLDTIRTIAETGVERISAGTLTHGAVWMDLAMDTLL